MRAAASGLVQGVGYRYFIQRTAVSMHLTGFVKNQADRSVLVEAQGQEKMLERFILAMKQGPELSVVEKVKVEWLDPESDWVDFQISF